jgi:hypothetical protein
LKLIERLAHKVAGGRSHCGLEPTHHSRPSPFGGYGVAKLAFTRRKPIRTGRRRLVGFGSLFSVIADNLGQAAKKGPGPPTL